MAKHRVTQKKPSAPIVDYDYVIGVDQSYSNTGIAVVTSENELLQTCNLKLAGKKQLKNCNKSRLRAKLINTLTKTLENIIIKEHTSDVSVCLIYERVRLISGGSINEDYIKDMSAMVGAIEDFCYANDIPCYSADTRSWKSQVVGTSKAQENDCYVDPKKYPTIKYVEDILGHTMEIREYLPENTRIRNYLVDNVGKFIYNDNVADAICIAYYGFKPKRLLRKEVKDDEDE